MPGVLPIISTLDDIAEAIADPPINRPIENAIGQQGRRICDAISNAPPWTTSGVGFMPAAGLMCGPYWAQEGISPPEVDFPFEGGQCVGAGYYVTYQYNAIGTAGQIIEPPTVQPGTGGINGWLGPIGGIRRVSEFGGTSLYLDTGEGPQLLRQSSAPQGDFANPKITLVQRAGGLPDNCGNPPPVITPGPNPSPRNPTIPPEEQPYVDPITGPTLPIPPIPTIPGLPDIELPTNPFGRGTEPTAPGLPGVPGEPVATGPGTGPGGGGGPGAPGIEGEAPPGSELIGLLFNLIEALPGSRQYGDGIYRAGAYIRMGTAVGLDQDFGGSQIEDGQFFFAERDGLTRWRVTANIGLNWLVTPYYREV